MIEPDDVRFSLSGWKPAMSIWAEWPPGWHQGIEGDHFILRSPKGVEVNIEVRYLGIGGYPFSHFLEHLRMLLNSPLSEPERAVYQSMRDELG